ncbi:MAG: erythromycin esterase family protein [Edaphobacter sp.]
MLRTDTPKLLYALARVAEPLSFPDAEYDSLFEQIGDACLVLIGEASHGTHDFYRKRARITRRLIALKGFNGVAAEATGQTPIASTVSYMERERTRPPSRLSRVSAAPLASSASIFAVSIPPPKPFSVICVKPIPLQPAAPDIAIAASSISAKIPRPMATLRIRYDRELRKRCRRPAQDLQRRPPDSRDLFSAEQKTVRPALFGSCEKLFHETGLGDFFLPLRDPDLRKALSAPLLERAIGVIYRPETERLSHYFETTPPAQFDAIIHIDRTRALVPLEKSTHWERGETPETCPFAV